MKGNASPGRLLFTSVLALAACTHRPPPDFAPDPGLVARIRAIDMRVPQRACPGQSFPASYDAVLDDGARIPFAARYDKKHPPRPPRDSTISQSAGGTMRASATT